MRKETGLRTAAVLGIACLVLLVLGLRWHPLWGAALAAGGCAGISLLLAAGPGRRALPFAGRAAGDDPAALEAAGRELKQLRLYADRIADRKTRDAAAALADTGGRIYDQLRQHPEGDPSAGRSLAARLDAAGRLLVQYVAYQEAGLHTPEAVAFQRRVRAALPGQQVALDRQLARLLSLETEGAETGPEPEERLPDPEESPCGTGVRSCWQ